MFLLAVNSQLQKEYKSILLSIFVCRSRLNKPAFILLALSLLGIVIFAEAQTPNRPNTFTEQSISLGFVHSCAISNGAAKCWGSDWDGQLGIGDGKRWGGPWYRKQTPVQVHGLSADVMAIAAGSSHSCAIQDGVAHCWGYNRYGQLGNGTITSRSIPDSIPVQVNGLSANVTAVAAGSHHSCAIQNGAANCWGYNRYGQLGDGTITSRSIPVQVSGLSTDVTTITVGSLHSCAIQNGAAKCWGSNRDGQLGDGTYKNRNIAVQVNGLSANVTAIAAGSHHSCAIQNGAAKCWGYDGNDQLGDGIRRNRNTPVQVHGLSADVTVIATGFSHSCAIQNGAAKCWGYNGYRQLGDGTYRDRNTPVQVSGLTADVTAIATGAYHSCAVQYGIVKCWGSNSHGQLGDGTRTSRNVPVLVAGLGVPGPLTQATIPSVPRALSVIEVTFDSITVSWDVPAENGGASITGYQISWIDSSARNRRSMASTSISTTETSHIITDLAPGTLYDIDVVAVNRVGSSVPVELTQRTGGTVPDAPTGLTRQSMSAGAAHSCAISNGAAKCWGDDEHGQLGDGNRWDSNQKWNTAVQVHGLSADVMAIAAGNVHGCAIQNGAAKCWGYNGYGQLGDGTNTSQNIPVQVHGLNANVTAIATEWNHTCAIQNGAAKCWGRNKYGQLGDGTRKNRNSPVQVNGLDANVTVIAPGGRHSCAIQNGAVKCWGLNYNGYGYRNRNISVQVNGLNADVTAIAAGDAHSCAIQNGAVKCWGEDNGGRLGDGIYRYWDTPTPVQVIGLNVNVTAIAAGDTHSCAIQNGAVKCWGEDRYDQLGDGNQRTWSHDRPVQVHGLSVGVTEIALGYSHICAIQRGIVKCRGYHFKLLSGKINHDNLVGYGIRISRVPVPVVGLGMPDPLTQATIPSVPRASRVTGVTFNSITVSWVVPVADGGAPITGYQISWRAGDTSDMVSINTTTTSYTITDLAPGTLYDIAVVAVNRVGDSLPVELSQRTAETVPDAPVGLTIQSISAGDGFSCAISNGAAKCWGYNGDGQLGDGTSTSRSVPVQVIGLETSVTVIAAGNLHSCATQNGVAKCWGYNGYGQLGDGTDEDSNTAVQVNGLNANVTAIATGNLHSCAIQNGAAKCWGHNERGQLGDGTNKDSNTVVQVNGLNANVTAIAAGVSHNCAIQNGAAKCWGVNYSGQLGDGRTFTSRSIPVQVTGLNANVTAIAAGSYYSCAIQNSTVKCWGWNEYGQLGDGTYRSRNTPEQVDRLTANVTAIAGGFSHTCAIQNGAAKCWGWNGYRQLGDGTDRSRNAPVQVHDLSADVMAIAAGFSHTCAVQNGVVKCWGWNEYGQLGDDTRIFRSAPVPVVGLGIPGPLTQATIPSVPRTLIATEVTFNSITVNWDVPVVDGGAPITGYQISWRGGDTSGMESISTTTTSYIITDLAPGTLYDIDVVAVNRVGGSVPVELSQRTVETAPDAPTRLKPQSISLGYSHSCAISNGAAKCWGKNYYGNLGDGTETDRNAPVQVIGLERGVTAIAAGDSYNSHTCAIQNSVAKCWGYSGFVQLDNGGQNPLIRLLPQRVPFLTAAVTAISVGDSHACAIQNGAAKCWGDNWSGQLGDGTDRSWKAPVQVNGLNADVTAIAAGNSHSCTIQNGAAKCWGDNSYGQLGDETQTDRNAPVQVHGLNANVTAIAAGWLHTCAIQNGAAKCWGYNSYRQLGDGTYRNQNISVQVNDLTADVTAIATGDVHSCAIQNGAAKCWGNNSYGKLGDGTDRDRNAPVQVHDLTAGATAIAVGHLHSCAIQHGIVKCWGYNHNGQLGDGTRISRSVPVPVVGIGEPDPVTQATIPSVPRTLIATAVTFNSITVNWDAPVAGGGAPITGYQISWHAGDTSSITSIRTTTTSYIITNLAPGTLYDIDVVAANRVGSSLPVELSQRTAETVPDAPAGLTVAEVTFNSITVNWDAPVADGGASITGYQISWRAGDTSDMVSINTAATSYIITNLAPGTLYDIDVVAVNRVGSSVPVELSQRTAETIPDAPAELRVAEATFNSITVNWDAPVADGGAPITGYQISWRAGDTSGMESISTTTTSYIITDLASRNAI